MVPSLLECSLDFTSGNSSLASGSSGLMHCGNQGILGERYVGEALLLHKELLQRLGKGKAAFGLAKLIESYKKLTSFTND